MGVKKGLGLVKEMRDGREGVRNFVWGCGG